MKNTIFSAIAMALVFTACSSDNTKSESTTDTTANAAKPTQTTLNAEQLYACSMHSEVIGKKADKCSKCGMELTVPVEETARPLETNSIVQNSNFSIAEIVTNYLKLKNALIKDEAKEAANAGNAIVVALAKLDMNSLTKKQMKTYMDVAEDAKEHAEHIAANAGKIDHQREHFAMLSKDVNDLIKTFGSSQKLFQDFCPMYDDGKGAIWISEFKEIKNPYFGNKMIGCGSVKRDF